MISNPPEGDLSKQDEFTKEQLEIDESLIPGQWEFKGYHPHGCRDLPGCYVHKLGFQPDMTIERNSSYQCIQT